MPDWQHAETQNLPIVPTELTSRLPITSTLLTSALSSIFQIPKLGTKLKQDTIPLSHTPRKFITHPHNGYFYLIEGDHRVMGEEAVQQGLDKLVCCFSQYLPDFC